MSHNSGSPNGKAKRIVKAPASPPESNDTLGETIKLSLRQEIEKKKEDKIRQEEANFTYKPSLVAKKQASATPNEKDENRFDKLYTDALKRHLQTTWKEDPGAKELTFQPKISKRASRSSSRNSSRNSSRENSLERNSVHDRLSASGSPKKHAQTKDENLTFQPQITKRAKSIERQQLKDPAERLYIHSQFVREKAEKRKQEADQQEREKYTFSPHLVPSKQRGSTPTKNVIDRMTSFEEFKNRKLEEAKTKKEREENEQLTFKPQLQAKRSATPTQESIFDRLSVIPQKQLELDPELTFKPKLITKRGPSPTVARSQENIHERLFKEGEQRKKELLIEMEQRREQSESDLTFKPNITSKLRKSVDMKVDTTVEGGEEENKAAAGGGSSVFQRLEQDIKDWTSMRSTLDKIKADMELKDCTFSPKLSTTPTAASNNNRDDAHLTLYDRQLQDRERTLEYVRKQKEEKEKEELATLTFQPNLPKSSVSLAKKRSGLNVALDNDTATESTTNVYQRLSSSPLSRSSSHHQLETVYNGDGSRKSMVLTSNDLEKVFERLNTPKASEPVIVPGVTPKKVVVQVKDLDNIVNRLNTTATQSFSFRLDPEKGAEETISAHRRETIKLTPTQLGSTVERLLTPTAASVANEHSMRKQSFSSTAELTQSVEGTPILKRKCSTRLSTTGSSINLRVPEPPASTSQSVVPPTPPTSTVKPTKPKSKVDSLLDKIQGSIAGLNDQVDATTREANSPCSIPSEKNSEQEQSKPNKAKATTPAKSNIPSATKPSTSASKAKPAASGTGNTSTTASFSSSTSPSPTPATATATAPVVIRRKKKEDEIKPLPQDVQEFIAEIQQVDETGSDDEN